MEQKQAEMTVQSSKQLEDVKTEIAALAEGEKASLINELKEHMAEQKFSARMRLRVESGDLENPMIQGILARIHWKRTRGTNWSAES